MTAPLSVAEVLERSADLIEPEGAFTKTFAARDGNGTPISPLDPKAECWCTIGAIERVTGSWSDPAILFFREYLGVPLIGHWNDIRTQAEVVTALREAAKKAREVMS